MGKLEGKVSARPVEISHWSGGAEGEALRAKDAWFHSHYIFAPHVICSALAPHVDLASSRILDLGCGDGIMSLGVQHAGGGRVACTDLTRAFDTLANKANDVLGLVALPAELEYRQGTLGQPLPFADGFFDAVYSWSVFEHVDGVEWLLREVVRTLRRGGVFYLQIEPLYYSPFGSHLLRLIEQPWAHLLHAAPEYLELATNARDHTRVEERDLLYTQNAFEDVKRYLISEYHSLNKIRTVDLVHAIQVAGLEILSCELSQVRGLDIPPVLLEQFDQHDLVTNEIRLVLRRN